MSRSLKQQHKQKGKDGQRFLSQNEQEFFPLNVISTETNLVISDISFSKEKKKKQNQFYYFPETFWEITKMFLRVIDTLKSLFYFFQIQSFLGRVKNKIAFHKFVHSFRIVSVQETTGYLFNQIDNKTFKNKHKKITLM